MIHTIDNPKKVKFHTNPEEPNFTGVVKDKWKSIAYYVDGKLHREDEPAVVYLDGISEYYLNGNLHRENGPAVISEDGAEVYSLNGKYHRENGPAKIYPNGKVEYWLNDEFLDICTNQELKDYLALCMFE